MEIAILLKDDKSVDQIVGTGAKEQVELFGNQGWILIDSDPAFSNDQKDLWTVRKSDSKLVHIATGMTPDEEKTQADALLGKTVGTALATANTASQKADNAIAGLALLGKQVAAQNTSTDGGTK